MPTLFPPPVIPSCCQAVNHILPRAIMFSHWVVFTFFPPSFFLKNQHLLQKPEMYVTNVCLVYLCLLDLAQMYKIHLFQSFTLLLNHLVFPFLKAGWGNTFSGTLNSHYFIQESLILSQVQFLPPPLLFLSAVHLEDVPWPQLCLCTKRKASWQLIYLKPDEFNSSKKHLKPFLSVT